MNPLSLLIRVSDSPFHRTGDSSSYYRRDTFLPAPVRLEDFLSPDAQALLEILDRELPCKCLPTAVLIITDNHTVQEVQASHAPNPELTEITDIIVGPALDAGPCSELPIQNVQGGFTTVDINELSAGLGLPAARTEVSVDAPPAATHEALDSRAQPGALYGELIGWARDKPLTAQGLAKYLKKQDLFTSPEVPAPAPVSQKVTAIQFESKIGNQPIIMPQQRFGHDQVAITTPVESMTVSHSPSAYHHQHRRSSASSASYRNHARVPSNRRYPRRPSRVKRIDQGPMPSAADIYPDDAHWMPFAPLHEALDFVSTHDSLCDPYPAPFDDVQSWPPLVQTCSSPEPVAPTAADIDAADDDVLTIIKELPKPSLDTLAKLSNVPDPRKGTDFDLLCDSRALTPCQLDGSRYGMVFHGLGLGTRWRLSENEENNYFETTTKNHDVWSGRDWALRRTWVEHGHMRQSYMD